MSFLSHIGLSVIDKMTGNALDKLGNAIKDGDVSEVIGQFTGILEGVEDKLGDISDLFEDAIDKAKKEVRYEVRLVKRKMMREVRDDLKDLHAQFGDKIAAAMEAKIAEMVEAEVERSRQHGSWTKMAAFEDLPDKDA